MQKSKEIEHLGIVQSITDRMIKVSFLQESACSTCHVQGVCSVPDGKDQEIEIANYSNKFSVGEQVNIVLEESLGMRALFLSYILPFILVVLILGIASTILKNDLQAGLISLFCLVPYYYILYLKRDKLKNTFSFKIRKLLK